ncbi:tetratricopeptide repeat protein [Streptomyces albipurpureus]|uniref:Sel1 repeat family protein n=1 Tax=Streptomyces albipurpureus TaxID=2897419 RepID=A0ABT0UJB0_9ACTN|nr:sel1 repeat family protein [Streptomyces sp. CWNU-1]MCM2388578.1 sel1 repeat family protein [Streptomyces sp. CWNU-1]
MAGILLFVAAVLSIIGVTTDRGTFTEVSWILWVLGILLLVSGALRRRRRVSVDELRVGAAGGDPGALRGLAMMAKIQGDFDEAERLLRMAVDNGDVESMWEMGRLVEQRDGLEESEPWFRMAAERGHFVAKRFFRPGNPLNRDGSNPL